MMKYTLALFFLFELTVSCLAQYEGPIPAITNGYGSYGTNDVSVSNMTNDHFLARDISVFYPSGTSTPVPAIFFLHGWGGIDTLFYQETIRNLASNGYAVVYVPYKSLGVTNAERYLTIYEGFVKAARNLTSIIDTTRVGFYGHSFGGGAVPVISYKLYTENNWGANGKFIYCDAPYYSFELGSNDLSNYPTDCYMLTVLFDKDDINDHRMGVDIFNNISIDVENKDCIIVYPDTVTEYIYEASHSEATQYTTNGVFNAYDYYVTFRLLGALADYTFTGNLTAKDIALGNGSPNQVSMGNQLKSLIVTDNPSPIYPMSIYTYQCSDPVNERTAFCQTILGIKDWLNETNDIVVYPNPSGGIIKIETEISFRRISVSVIDITGKEVLKVKNQTQIDINSLEDGNYVIVVSIDNKVVTQKVIKL